MKHVHFIGIKGVGMSALAIVAQGLGYLVTGSDVPEEFITDSSLRKAGITVLAFARENITPSIDLVVRGAAFGPDHPEVQQTHAMGTPITSYAAFLGELSSQKTTIAVAGTHGKTTTTALTSFLLYHADQDPSWVIGTGHVAGLPSHGHAGQGPLFVTEADDYKVATDDPTPKFVFLHPRIAILTSIEHDHPDLYPTLEDCIQAFRRLLGQVAPDGTIIAYGDDPTVLSLVHEFPTKKLITYGFTPHAMYRIIRNGASFMIETDDARLGPFTLPLPGKHNLLNATAAIIAALIVGVSAEEIQAILPTFQTVERRYEQLGERDGIIVIDDYAHHPTAVTTTLEATKEQYPDRALWVLFQSHTYSRTKTLLHEFATAFNAADHVVITDIFGSARESAGDITAQDMVVAIAKYHTDVRYIPKDELLSFIRQTVPTGSIVVTMGAGDIYKIGKAFISGGSPANSKES